MYLKIIEVINSLDVARISEERKELLKELIEYIQEKAINNDEIRLNFICTHNSRRSHLSQVWAQTMAHYFQINNVFCYSGGTEATALFPMVVTTLQEKGFQIQSLAEGKNPIYSIKFSKKEPPIIGFSKVYDHLFNPTSSFAAIITCSQADTGCPFIAETEKRIPITYEDPKVSDNTFKQTEVYSNRSLQIATEMYYVFSQINC